jgi:predicted transcriptional regulator
MDNVVGLSIIIICCLGVGYFGCYFNNRNYILNLLSELHKKEKKFKLDTHQFYETQRKLNNLKLNYKDLQFKFIELEKEHAEIIDAINNWDLNKISNYRTEQ